MAFDDAYIIQKDGAWADASDNAGPDQNCYMVVDVRLHLKDELEDSVLDAIESRLKKFLSTTFWRNDGLFRLYLAMERCAVAGIPPKVLLFLKDAGGKGKSMLSMLRAHVWKTQHSFVDPSAFVGEEEFRKAGSDFSGSRFYTVQETKRGRIQLDILKKAITNEKIAVRPNFGKKTYMLPFGRAMWVWEVNEAPEIDPITRNVSDSEDWLTRRTRVGHFQQTITPEADCVDAASGVFSYGHESRYLFASRKYRLRVHAQYVHSVL